MEDDSGTETDTSSDSGHEEIDMADLNGLNHGEAFTRIGNIDCTNASGAGFQASLLASSGASASASE